MVIVVILSRDTPKPTKNGRGGGKEGKDRKRNVATINGQEEVNSTRYLACLTSQINQGIKLLVKQISHRAVYYGDVDGKTGDILEKKQKQK